MESIMITMMRECMITMMRECMITEEVIEIMESIITKVRAIETEDMDMGWQTG
jgi:hypothetical protein